MPLRSDEAFVLTRHPYRERDLTVALLSRTHGLVRVLARRARGLRSPLAAVLEPLAQVRMTYFERPRSELANLNEAVLVRSSFPLAASPAGWAAGQVVGELALTFCPPGEQAELAYRLVDRCLARLLAGHSPLAVAHYAELWFLRLAGVFPELGACGECGASLGGAPRIWDDEENRFLCPDHPPPRAATRLSAAAAAWLARASRERLEEITAAAPADAATWLARLRERFTGRELVSWRYLSLLQS
ncbi:MAG: DNA repair protein RecO [Acidobacteriota bacterium]